MTLPRKLFTESLSHFLGCCVKSYLRYIHVQRDKRNLFFESFLKGTIFVAANNVIFFVFVEFLLWDLTNVKILITLNLKEIISEQIIVWWKKCRFIQFYANLCHRAWISMLCKNIYIEFKFNSAFWIVPKRSELDMVGELNAEICPISTNKLEMKFVFKLKGG